MKVHSKLIVISIMILGLLIILLLNGCFLFRQYGSIEGYVYVPDKANKGAIIIIRDINQIPSGYKPLPGAKVSVTDSYNFTFTDNNGYFLLTNVLSGLVNLTIEPPVNSGYNSLSTQVMVEPDSTVSVGTYGAVSLPSEGIDNWDIVINQIDYSEYPKVKVYVQILDPINNTPMVGVKSDNFIIEINGESISPLSVIQAEGTTSLPASTSLVIDRSGSMEGEYGDDQPLIDAKEAAITFVNLMASTDRAEIISFGDNATIEQPFTNNKQALITAIEGISVHGWTALYDAIWQGLDDTATEASPRKAVIALTDGGENWSSSIHGGGDPPDNSLLIAHAQSLNITVYTIGLAGYDFTREKVVRSYTTSEADLQEIAEETGGEYFYAPTSADLEHIYVEITRRVQQQYIITFTDNTGITDGILTVKVNYNQISGEASKTYGLTTSELIDWYRYQGADDSDDKKHNCGPACVAMAIQFTNETYVPIREIRDHIGHLGDTNSEELKECLQYYGISYEQLSEGGQNVIDAVNNRNHIVICPVTMSYFSPGLDIDSESEDDSALHYDRYSSFSGGHFIIVKSISLDGNWVIVYDPNVWGSYPYPKYWYSNGEPKGKNRYYRLSEFYDAIKYRGIEITSKTLY